MNPKIRNFNQLISHGDTDSRKIILTILEKTLAYLDAYKRIKSIAFMEGNILHVGKRAWDLSKKRHIYLIGAGKACNSMAMAFDEILGERLTKGIAIVKIAEADDRFKRTDVYVGGHPLPNEEGYQASKKIIQLVDNATKDDLFIAVISGGSSALMNCPRDGISLDDEIKATDILLKSGANIYEINAIRRHISQTNGGMLAKRIAEKGAELIGVGISDAIGTPMTSDISVPYKNYKSTPIGPDNTTLEDARHVIKKYRLENRLPNSIVDYLAHAGHEGETPKAFPHNTYFLLNTLPDSCRFAKKTAEDMGLNAMILTSFLEGESKEAGRFFASVGKEIKTYGNPIKPPCVVISSGETSTVIASNESIKGHGGPGHELVAAFATAVAGSKGLCMLSVDSEGTDGTTNAAGGICDSTSMAMAQEKNIDLYSALRGHATHEALDTIGDTIITGNTGTNLCDLNIMYVPK
jgi:glycerate 2-kinase